MLTDRATPQTVRPDDDPLADPNWQEPEQPGERLSWFRLLFLILALGAVGAGSTFGAMRLRENAGTRAKSWAVPYVDVTLTPTFEFQDPDANPANDVALGFVVADRTDGCVPSWGGAYTLDEAAASLELDRRISQLRAAGGNIMVSVGGQSNTELAVACADQARLTEAYRQLVKRYQLATLDLDVEGAALGDQASLKRRAAALKTVQDERKAAGDPLAVWLTVPVSPSGLTADGLAAVRATLDGGVALRGVNVMTMDYGTGNSANPDMLGLTTQALDNTHKQLTDLYLRLGAQLTSAQVWSRIGATPMIGQNDVDTERFTVADAQGLATFAVDKGLGRVSMWSLNRDARCKGTFTNVVVHSNTCSGVDQQALAFSKVFAGLPGTSVGSSGRDAVEIPNRSSAIDDPTTSPYPVWRLTAQYVGGYKVVWHGVVYQAKWANSGADPSADDTAGAPNPWSVVGPVTTGDKRPTPTPNVTGVTNVWNPGTSYHRGDRVTYNDLPYEARWTTRGDAPSTDYPVDPDEAWAPLFTVPGEPVVN
ncbi:chitinase [Actinoplanes sp. SE50]|uniref:chitinase n=2 Tax=Actinoplanes TaxID=1865 RepID=UPI00023ECDDC|nr:chitinase [Actinoplanes sp. SE50/110]AEV81575.1 chitinase [Actinoplanes sp. SE50/110]ATO79977.1 chitinase [Actinoplanes sp. SE50]SLL97379.1 chitinase [Actinoplanes sp. SE50/110]